MQGGWSGGRWVEDAIDREEGKIGRSCRHECLDGVRLLEFGNGARE